MELRNRAGLDVLDIDFIIDYIRFIHCNYDTFVYQEKHSVYGLPSDQILMRSIFFYDYLYLIALNF